ncbi:trans-sialidase, partial [Trypanosoma grayi]|uniref:trans-sialidase n=1 Tax=Trypanosoma grayi TaxID=71804 RepID=UPI0004F4049B
AGGSPVQMFLAGLQRKAAASPIKEARPMERRGLDLVGYLSTLENGQLTLRLAWVTASRWGEIALLQKENFIPHPQYKEALIVDWGALPKTFKIDPHRAARYAVIGGEDAKRVRGVTKGMVEGERPTMLTTRDMENLLRPLDMTARSIKRGALAQAAAAVIEHDLGPRLLV